MIATSLVTQNRYPTLVYRWLLVGLLLSAGLMTGCSRPSADSITALTSPAGAGSAEPHLSRGQDGTVVLSWLEPAGDNMQLRYSVLNTSGWAPAVTVARGNDWFVNWADFPSVTSISAKLWAAHWLKKRPGGTYAYDVVLALSHDGGQSWDAPIIPHTDGTRTEHGFVSLFPWKRGVGALWLDGRNMVEDGHGTHGATDAGGMTLRSAIIGVDTNITNPRLIDDLVCDCCQTDIAITDNGPIAVYRNRTREEIRDIYVARSIDGSWLPGQLVADDGWEISGCPVNGPAIVANGTDVAVAWFTAPNNRSKVQLARSIDGGASFASPIDIDADRPIGRVDVELIENGDAVVSWVRKGEHQQGEICVRSVTAGGRLGPIRIVAKTNAARPSGFPQMTQQAGDLIFAWTDTFADQSLVKSARIPIISISPLDQ